MPDETTSGGIRTTAEPASGGAGVAVDAAGTPAVDPTQNVLDLVAAAIQRQDDLRNAEKEHLREVLELRTELGNQDSRCAAEIAEVRTSFQRRIDDIHEKHAENLRRAESARIDAIRAVDVGAVQSAAEVQATQASTLASQVAASAEAMRTQVAAAAAAAQTALAAALEPIIKDIADLRRAQYEAQGQKTQVVETQARGGSFGMWIGVAIAGSVGFVSILGAIVVLATQ